MLFTHPKFRLNQIALLARSIIAPYKKIKSIGYAETMDDYEKRKLGVFNQVNFLGVIVGLSVSIAGLFDDQDLPGIASVVAFSPVIISLAVLLFNYYKKYEWARIIYFSLYPVLTFLVYKSGMDLGLELFFILYAALAVFYMQKAVNAVFSFVLSSGCYLATYVFAGEYTYRLSNTFFPFYVFVHVLAIVLLFFALFWLKRENIGYQFSILKKNDELHLTNLEIEKQKKEIGEKAEQLIELDALKNKLFSVISHDLRGPMYAQRNIFQNVVKYDLPGDQLKEYVPEILADMNATLALMDNLLHWSKSQMQSEVINMELIDMSAIAANVTELLLPQAKGKGVHLINKLDAPAYLKADKDMMNVVVRNLLSNAIKFTNHDGEVIISSKETNNFIEISISDTGVGMTEEVLKKITENNFYSTRGTKNESGTGLGLRLCGEFLVKNNSSLLVKSEPGKGSIFSFKFPLQQECLLKRKPAAYQIESQ